MRVAVIGGGLMGTSLAYYLAQQGQQVTLLEQNAELGGLSSVVEVDDGLTIPRFPHYALPNDHHLHDLITRFGLQHHLKQRPARAGFVNNGAIYPMQTAWDLLRFNSLPLRDRLLLGHTVLQARLTRNWRFMDSMSIEDWLVRIGGRANFERVWAPLLEAKFDYAYDNIPATFIWSWLNRMSPGRTGLYRRARVSYLPGGLRLLIDAMADAIVARGGEIKTRTRVREIELVQGKLGRVRTHTGMFEFEAVIAAIPGLEFRRLLLSADEAYLQSLGQARYLGLICPMLILDQPLSDYWTLNLTDPSSPFASIVEMPHPHDPQRRVVYLPKYTAPEDDWLGVPDEVIREAWLPRLYQIYPALKPENIQRFVVSRARYAEPVHWLNGADRLSPVATRYRGLYLVNSSQVYPHLPTSNAIVDHARAIARLIARQGQPGWLIPTAA